MSPFVTTSATNNYSGWAYGVRWHIIIIPLLFFAAHSLFMNPPKWIKITVALLTAWGFVFAVIGAVDPWTMTLTQTPSYKALFEDDPQYVTLAYTTGQVHLNAGRLALAKERFEESLRRDHYYKPALKALAITIARME